MSGVANRCTKTPFRRNAAERTAFPKRPVQEGDVLLAGDVTLDLPALEAQRDQGFIADVEAHHQTLPRVLALVRTGVAYLPSHDPESPARLNRSAEGSVVAA